MSFNASTRRGGGVTFAVAGLMLLLWLATFALASSPQLHALIHPDANAPDHQCLVTQLQHHQLLSGLVLAVAPPAPAPFVELVPCTDFHLPTLSDCRLSPSRAPPSTPPPAAVAG